MTPKEIIERFESALYGIEIEPKYFRYHVEYCYLNLKQEFADYIHSLTCSCCSR